MFGDWSIVDAFFAPVVLRFRSYDVEIESPAREWAQAVIDDPDMREWLGLAAQETEIVAADEAGKPAA